MDPATLASAVTAFLIPKLAEFGVDFLEDAGKALWDRIVEKLKDRPAGAGSAGEFSQAADDTDNQEAFTVQLRKLLKEDPNFAEELEGLLKEAENTDTARQAAVVADRGSTAMRDLQVKGSNTGAIIVGSGNQVSQSGKLTEGKPATRSKKKR